MATRPDSPRYRDITVRVTLPDDERARTAALSAYAFSQSGKLLDAKWVEKGEAAIRVPLGAEGTRLRVFIGPRIDGNTLSLTELSRRSAIERHVRLDLNSSVLTLDIPIQIDKILCWIRGLCFVNGTVVKRTTLSGQTIDQPVCNATVEVYEVDPFWIVLPKLPQLIIDRIRDIIINPVPLPHPLPDPLPGPFSGPFPPDPIPGSGPFFNAARLTIPKGFSGASARVMSAHTDSIDTMEGLKSAPALQFAARAASDLDFRRVLLDHAELIRPIFCRLYPDLFTMRLVATAQTDDCGHFHTLFFNGCNNPDTPDIYFKVKQRFLFFDLTIYAPTPVPCHTWWNYRCGSEVTLYTHHPLAQTCPPVVAGDN